VLPLAGRLAVDELPGRQHRRALGIVEERPRAGALALAHGADRGEPAARVEEPPLALGAAVGVRALGQLLAVGAEALPGARAAAERAAPEQLAVAARALPGAGHLPALEIAVERGAVRLLVVLAVLDLGGIPAREVLHLRAVVAGLDGRELVEREPRARHPRGDLRHRGGDVLEVRQPVRRGDPLGQRAADRALDQVADGADAAVRVDEDRAAPRDVGVAGRRPRGDVIAEVAEQLGAPPGEIRPRRRAAREEVAHVLEVDVHPQLLGIAGRRRAAGPCDEAVIPEVVVGAAAELARPAGLADGGERGGGEDREQGEREAHTGGNARAGPGIRGARALLTRPGAGAGLTAARPCARPRTRRPASTPASDRSPRARGRCGSRAGRPRPCRRTTTPGGADRLAGGSGAPRTPRSAGGPSRRGGRGTRCPRGGTRWGRRSARS